MSCVIKPFSLKKNSSKVTYKITRTTLIVFCFFVYIYSVEKFSIKEASKILGISERAVKYYRGIYSSEKFVISVDRNVFLTQSFIDAVSKNRKLNARISTEPRTKEELLKVIEELTTEIKELKNIVLEYENSEIFEKSNDGFRVEVFSEDEYNLFSERLIEWRVQRKELEAKNVHFESLKEERDFIKLQLEYFKNSNDKILLQHQNLIEIIGQRNRIEAVEKGAIPREPKDI